MLTPVEEAATASLVHTGTRVIRLHHEDDVVVSLDQLVSGTFIASENVTVLGLIPPGHKMATRGIEAGSAVRRYGQTIGFATQAIRAGQHVHTHNLAIGEFTRDYAFGSEARVTPAVTSPAMFQGIVRADGRVATRNYIGILTSAWRSCSVRWGATHAIPISPVC